MRIKYDELRACVDCVMYLANGEIPEDRPNLADEIASEWPTETNLVLTGNEEDEEEFCSSSCDCCGSHLAGSRSGFVVLEEDTNPC